MKLTIRRTELEKLMKGTFGRVPRAGQILTITVANGQIFFDSSDGGAGTLVEVQRRGEVQVPALGFRRVLDTFKGTPTPEIEGSADGLRLNSFRMPVSAWNPDAVLPEGI